MTKTKSNRNTLYILLPVSGFILAGALAWYYTVYQPKQKLIDLTDRLYARIFKDDENVISLCQKRTSAQGKIITLTDAIKSIWYSGTKIGVCMKDIETYYNKKGKKDSKGSLCVWKQRTVEIYRRIYCIRKRKFALIPHFVFLYSNILSVAFCISLRTGSVVMRA